MSIKIAQSKKKFKTDIFSSSFLLINYAFSIDISCQSISLLCAIIDITRKYLIEEPGIVADAFSIGKFLKNLKQENFSLEFYKFIIHTCVCYKLSEFLKLIQIRKINFFYLFYKLSEFLQT